MNIIANKSWIEIPFSSMLLYQLISVRSIVCLKMCKNRPSLKGWWSFVYITCSSVAGRGKIMVWQHQQEWFKYWRASTKYCHWCPPLFSWAAEKESVASLSHTGDYSCDMFRACNMKMTILAKRIRVENFALNISHDWERAFFRDGKRKLCSGTGTSFLY